MRARIAGTGSSLPRLRVTNDDLGKIMDTSDEWIRSRTGIGARHIAVEETTASMSVAAAKQALEEAGIQAEELDLIIAATLTPDHILPPLSCEVQSALGASNAAAYDLCAACIEHRAGIYTKRDVSKYTADRCRDVIQADGLDRPFDVRFIRGRRGRRCRDSRQRRAVCRRAGL